MEIVQLWLSFFIVEDIHLYDDSTKKRAKVKNSSLVEELGRIRYVLADKTGTLTKNEMNLEKCGVDENVCENFHSETLHNLFLNMALCHTVEVETNEEGERTFQASSEDERALVVGSKEHGIEFMKREGRNVLLQNHGVDEVWNILAILPFDSIRKRMSVICQKDSTLWLFSKGAPGVILDSLRNDQEDKKGIANKLMEDFTESGLRMLCMGQKQIDRNYFETWEEKWQEAITSLSERVEKMRNISNEIEDELEFVGVVGLRDELQNYVPQTLQKLSEAGMNIWLITGDAVETAIRVATRSGVIRPHQHLQIIKESENISVQMENVLASETPRAVVLSGSTWRICYKEESDKLQKIAKTSSAVVVARAAPGQKAEAVSLVRTADPHAKVLAIGDGANDVSMIRAAHVGIGIRGKEGTQAAQAADYAISQFSFLQRLLLVHGRWAYKRIAKLVLYSFYKNIAFILVLFWFMFYSRASGQTIYEDWSLAMYNTLFTLFPILLYGVFEQDVNEGSLVRFPKLYQLGPQNKEFNLTLFSLWIFEAIYHSVVIFFGVYLAFSAGILSIDGLSYGIWSMGILAYTVVIFVVSFKVIVETK